MANPKRTTHAVPGILCGPDVPENDRQRLGAVLSGSVPLAVMRGTFHGREATILCVAIPGPETAEGQTLGMVPVAVMFEAADATSMTGPDGAPLIDARTMQPIRPEARETLHTGLYL